MEPVLHDFGHVLPRNKVRLLSIFQGGFMVQVSLVPCRRARAGGGIIYGG